MPNRRSGEWLDNGICDLLEESGRLKRTPFRPYIDELRRWQRRLDRVTELDEDPSSDPVDLADIEVAAERKGPTSEGLVQVMGATASGPLGFR